MSHRVPCLFVLLAFAGPLLAQPASGIEPPLDVAFKVSPGEIAPPSDGPPPIHLVPVVPPALKLLTQASVQREVDLTARQPATVSMLSAAWDIPPGAWEVGTLFLISPELGRRIVNRQTDDFLATGLTRNQRTRLNQIVFQLREREFGAYAAFAMAARDLGLRPEQVEDVSNLKGLRIEEIAKHVTSGDRFEKIRTKVVATNGETFERMTEMLSKSQRERLNEMRGKPFTGKVDLGPRGMEGRPQTYPHAMFGVYDFELRYFASERIRMELDLTNDQRMKVGLAAQEWDKEYRERGLSVERAGELHEITAKALDEILTARQLRRFHELMARRRLDVGGPAAACGYPAVITALRITPVQLSALKEGKPAADVLTKSDSAALDAFLGQPMKEPAEVSDPIMARHLQRQRDEERLREAPRPFSVFARGFLVISDRLKLSEKQITRLRELAEDEPKIMELIQKELDFADTPPVVGAGRGLTSANAVASRFKASIEEQCWNVLDARQQSMARRMFGGKKR